MHFKKQFLYLSFLCSTIFLPIIHKMINWYSYVEKTSRLKVDMLGIIFNENLRLIWHFDQNWLPTDVHDSISLSYQFLSLMSYFTLIHLYHTDAYLPTSYTALTNCVCVLTRKNSKLIGVGHYASFHRALKYPEKCN